MKTRYTHSTASWMQGRSRKAARLRARKTQLRSRVRAELRAARLTTRAV